MRSLSDSVCSSATSARAGRRRGAVSRGLSALALSLLTSACDESSLEQGSPLLANAAAAARADAAAAVQQEPDAAELARRACEEKRDAVLSKPALPGAPGFERRRVEILARVKTEPVLFVDTPQPDEKATPAARALRRALGTNKYPWDLLKSRLATFRFVPEIGRGTLLRDGYLYSEDPLFAYALIYYVRAHHLFDAPKIWIQRGDKTLDAERTRGGTYVYTSGPEQGRPVQLILLDRIGKGEPPPPLARDVRSLRYRLHFDHFTPVHMTGDAMVANLRYGGIDVPTVLRSEGARLSLECERVRPEDAKDLALLRERRARLLRVTEKLRDVIRDQVEEALPFDEPRREWGQQDGILRLNWLSAYRLGRNSFDFNGDRYHLFDKLGRPLVPQVCVDFLTDTFERASGSWWPLKGEPRGRTAGRFEFTRDGEPLPRRVPDFIELARHHAEWFTVRDIPEREQIPLWRRERVQQYLLDHAAQYRAGDIVVIRGYTNFEKPGERKVMHYHSFFVYETDPVTGFPFALVGNPGKPSLRTWEFETRRTPKRSIRHRVRPRLYWLEQIIDPGFEATGEPPLLTIGPIE